MEEVLKKYKEEICPYCIHYLDTYYQECKIVMQADGQANCVNYKRKEYCRKKKKNEIKNK